MRYLLTLFIVLFGQAISAQENSIPPSSNDGEAGMERRVRNLPPKKNGDDKGQEVTIRDYKIINYERDTTFLDTTISIQKEYKYNFLRRDDFELMPFANVGQTYNKLGVNFDVKDTYPKLGASAKHYNYMEVRDIDYYNVATPMSDLMFKTTFEQGQLLDALLAFNTSRRLNFSIGYKGFRSLGKYQYSEAESGNFKMTANYESKDKRYNLRAHGAAQNSLFEENGGLSNKELQFESGDSDFSDRSRLDVLFSDATNRLLGKRYYLDHQYLLFGSKLDSGKTRTTSLALGHEFSYETKYYQYKQTAQNDYFGDGYDSSISDKASLKTTYNQVYAQFSNKTLGVLTGLINHYHYNYFFNSVLQTPTQLIQSQLSGDEISAGAKYVKKIGGFQLNGAAQVNISGDLSGNLLDAFASYDINKNNKLKFSIHSSSRMPNFNFLLYQSDYSNYNWQHTGDFNKINNNGFQFDLESRFFGNLMAKYTSLDNYTYFASDPAETLVEGEEQAFVRPFQEGSTINILKVKYAKEFKWKGFALNNTVMYQDVSQTNNVLNVPQLVTRNTLYYSNFGFKKALYFQTGVTLKYFTSYNADAYNPVLGEFYLQNQEELGGFPMLDFFINARVQQTRIFLKAEHFNSSFSGNNFYAAPNYPYRDFVIRFGLVWNFFS